MKKSLAVLSILGILGFVSLASAHVVVKPNSAGIGSFQTFTIGVPSEKPIATIAVRLVLPQGLNYVTPTVKPGWQINIKKDGDKATEIDWTAGSVPAGQRDDFTFSAQVPAAVTALSWKAYQTYQDGSVVSWDQDPSQAQPKNDQGNADFSKVGPFSTTQVVNDLAAPKNSWWDDNINYVSLGVGVLALVIALWSRRRKA